MNKDVNSDIFYFILLFLYLRVLYWPQNTKKGRTIQKLKYGIR